MKSMMPANFGLIESDLSGMDEYVAAVLAAGQDTTRVLANNVSGLVHRLEHIDSPLSNAQATKLTIMIDSGHWTDEQKKSLFNAVVASNSKLPGLAALAAPTHRQRKPATTTCSAST